LEKPLVGGRPGQAAAGDENGMWLAGSWHDVPKAVNWAAAHAGHWFAARWSDDMLRSRTAAHLAVVLLITLVIVLGSTSLYPVPRSHRYLTPLSLQQQDDSAPVAGSAAVPQDDSSLLPSAPLANDSTILRRAAVPYTIIPERPREEIIKYVVQPGDTILGIAAQFGVVGETVMWANGRLEDNPDLLRVGQEVLVLPVDGVYHQVGAGDTVGKIAAAFSVEPSAIIEYPLNNLDSENAQITVGQWLVVPGGVKPYVPRQVVAYSGPVPEDATIGTGSFGWPAAGQITQGYWDRHRAIDVGSWEGAPVIAADSGYVVAAGWDDGGYGRMVVIDHGNGFQTLYAHLQVYYVEVGSSVAKGQAIAEVGTTGNSTGPHLHFEVRKNQVQRNPFGFLP